jgi:SAM-dependent methyltransferase
MQPRTLDRDTAALLDAYNEVAYISDPNGACHPNRLAAIGRLLGLDTAPIANCRVLELACGEGINLVPVAATLPQATFVGIDIAEAPLARARRMAEAIGLTNLQLLNRDLADLPADLGPFDYIVAHGVYSWVPDAVRAGLLPSIARLLAPDGVAFVSYNTLPGCHLRRAVWDLLRHHTRDIADRRSRMAAARALCSLVAAPVPGQTLEQEAFRSEVRRAGEASDAELEHDNLAPINHAVHFRDFLADASAARLTFLAEAELGSMLGAGLAAEVRQALGRMDRLEREQYLDFLSFRRYRESLVCHTGALSRFVVQPDRALPMHAVATAQLRLAAPAPRAAGDPDARALKELLLARFPGSVPVAEWAEQRGRERAGATPGTPRPAAQLVVEAYVTGDIDLRVEPVAVAATPGERPEAFAAARWLAGEHAVVPSLYHEVVRLEAPVARQLVALLDGTRTRGQLLTQLGDAAPATDAPARLEHLLGQLAASALLVR